MLLSRSTWVFRVAAFFLRTNCHDRSYRRHAAARAVDPIAETDVSDELPALEIHGGAAVPQTDSSCRRPRVYGTGPTWRRPPFSREPWFSRFAKHVAEKSRSKTDVIRIYLGKKNKNTGEALIYFTSSKYRYAPRLTRRTREAPRRLTAFVRN